MFDVDIRRVGTIILNIERIGALGTARRVAALHGVPLEAMLVRRLKTCTEGRHRLWTMIRHSTSLSYPEIGAVFEVDHTTVLGAVRKRETELYLTYRTTGDAA